MNRVVHFEILGEDTSALREFYEEAFGWKTTPWEGPFEYFFVTTGAEDTPGIDGAIAPPGSVQDQKVVLTVEVEDIDAATEQVLDAGGSIHEQKQGIPGVGWNVYCKDPSGVIIGLMQEDVNAR